MLPAMHALTNKEFEAGLHQTVDHGGEQRRLNADRPLTLQLVAESDQVPRNPTPELEESRRTTGRSLDQVPANQPLEQRVRTATCVVPTVVAPCKRVCLGMDGTARGFGELQRGLRGLPHGGHMELYVHGPTPAMMG